MAPPRFLLPLLALGRSILANPAPAPAVTEGPQAYVSIASMEPFSTLKPCAQGCLKYNGPYHCNLVGYNDIGKALKCGCSPLNYCLCDTREASSATSYIQSCVQTGCGLPQEVSAVLDIFNGYCATANTALATTSSKPYSFTGVTSKTLTGSEATVTGGSSSVAETGRAGSSASATAASSTGTTSPGASKGGLGIGAIIGIAVGGVVLIAALLCAGCCLLFRRHRNKKKALNASGVNNQGFTAGGQDVTYIAPNGGAVQIDGAGVYGKPALKVEEKVASPNVSPMQTPVVKARELYANGEYEQVPVPVAYEKHGNDVYGSQQGHNRQVYEKPADDVYEKP